MKNSTLGFSPAELLIVAAIIAVLVGIGLPVFNSQLERSREAVDASNIRSAYAELMANVVLEENTGEVVVDLKQTKEFWSNSEIETSLYSLFSKVENEPNKGGKDTLKYKDNEVGLYFSGTTEPNPIRPGRK